MPTEKASPRYVDLDTWPSRDMLEAMLESQLAAAAAVQGALGDLTAAVEEAVIALGRGGRLVYAGAGTSGRIAIQDGAELAPTFDWPADRLVFVMAGGMDALVRSAEGAEDDSAAGAGAIAQAAVGPDDVVVGVAASGTTRFTVAALRAASASGSLTIAITNNAAAPLLQGVRHRIVLPTGAEVVAGSTRMKAGTAQKIALNLFSTGVMIRLGRVYRGQMVQMHAGNAKLRRRAAAIVGRITGCPTTQAAQLVKQADGDVKTAVLLGLGLDKDRARAILQRQKGDLRLAIDAVERTHPASRD